MSIDYHALLQRLESQQTLGEEALAKAKEDANSLLATIQAEEFTSLTLLSWLGSDPASCVATWVTEWKDLYFITSSDLERIGPFDSIEGALADVRFRSQTPRPELYSESIPPNVMLGIGAALAGEPGETLQINEQTLVVGSRGLEAVVTCEDGRPRRWAFGFWRRHRRGPEGPKSKTLVIASEVPPELNEPPSEGEIRWRRVLLARAQYALRISRNSAPGLPQALQTLAAFCDGRAGYADLQAEMKRLGGAAAAAVTIGFRYRSSNAPALLVCLNACRPDLRGAIRGVEKNVLRTCDFVKHREWPETRFAMR
jgi:hypothetical protein